MSRTKMVFVSLLTVLAVGAAMSASASAFLWQVSGKKNFGSEQISTAAIALESNELKGDGIRIVCPKLKIEGGLINEGNPGTGKATSVVFSECVEKVEEGKCQLENPAITTKSVTLEVVAANEVEIAPAVGNEFVTVNVIKKGLKACLIEGAYQIKGTVRLTVVEPAIENSEHLLTFNANSNLTINTNLATIEGSGKWMLVLLLPWSIQM